MIIPALLTEKREELITMLNKCAEFTDYVQIDIMDGLFVPSRSVGISDLENLSLPVKCEAHLMVVNPLEWLEPFRQMGAKRIIYHFEIEKDHPEVISKIKEMNMEAGIAVNPSTDLDGLKPLAAMVDTVLFMSVKPGFYGAQFIPEVLDKARNFKRQYPEISLGIDGGVKLDNLFMAQDAGLDYVCVGSAILRSKDPQQAYSEFKERFLRR